MTMMEDAGMDWSKGGGMFPLGGNVRVLGVGRYRGEGVISFKNLEAGEVGDVGFLRV